MILRVPLMAELCVSCGAPVATAICPNCSAVQPREEGPDPLIGAVITDRYEITQLLSVGGMARIYRALQRSLDRTVVVKVIDPALLSADDVTADEAVQRFMVEAQAASRLNHPNVVSIFDFGRAAPSAGGYLFLVMEYLAGPDLWTVMQNDAPLPFVRIASILKQALAALGEAHYLGITHRDVKPENIICEPRRRGDHVKVIDFGLAKLAAMQSVTAVGKTVGTPHYMAPEQVQGAALGSADLYAIGVILFEMLTGQVPFDGQSPVEIMLKHIRAPRPDPRIVAPKRGIPPELAEVCMRAMAADASGRYPDAESLAQAIEDAVGAAQSERVSIPPGMSLPPDRSSRASLPDVPPQISRLDEPEGIDVDLGDDGPSRARLVARDADLAWAWDALVDPAVTCAGLTGRTGLGRTRLLEEVAAAAEREGGLVVRVSAPPHPRQEVGYGALRVLVSRLVAVPPTDTALASGALAKEPLAAAGLRAIYLGETTKGSAGPSQTRTHAAQALSWALGRALERSKPAPLVVAVDDLDRLDTASRHALGDVVAKPPRGDWTLVTTSEEPVTELPGATTRWRALSGLTQTGVAALRAALGGEPITSQRRESRETDLEPLHVVLVHQWGLDRSATRVPARLTDLVEWRVMNLTPAERRVLQAVALTGGGLVGELAAVVREKDLDQALDPLIETGFLAIDVDEGVWLSHELFGRIALALAPSGAVSEVHARASEALAKRDGPVELRAYHSIRAKPDFETFMVVEDCAALRSLRGDDEGAIAILSEGVRAGRTMLARGDVEAGSSACLVFGQKLGAALMKLGRADAAVGVLKEALGVAPKNDRSRAPILDLLAQLSAQQGRAAEAEEYRREAATIARPRPRISLPER